MKHIIIILKEVFIIIHHRFMDLPAQAIRCNLEGVCPPMNPDGSRGWKYNQETFEFMRSFRRKPAIAFFSEWVAGQVGHIDEKSSSFEFRVKTIL